MGGGRLVAVLYKANETDFNHLGLGPLNDAVSILVTEERNGMFELEMAYPVEGSRFVDLKLDRLIKADAGYNLKNQRFKIIRITKPIDGIVTVNAEHVSYLTQDLALKPTVNYSGSASQALNTWNNNIVDNSPFIVASDITTVGSGSWSIKEVKNAREALGGVSGSILETYGGEYRFDNYSIRLMAQRGVNSGALIAYGRNLVDLTQEESIADTFTSVYPYAVYQNDDNKEVLLTLPEYFVDSEYVGSYARRKILPVDFSSDEIKDVATLRSRANAYIKSNGVGIPKVNMKIKYIDLAKTLDYKDLTILEEVNLCDNVSIYFEQLGVNTSAKIIKTVWDDLLEQYDSIEVGEAKSSLSNSINSTVDGKLETIVQRVNTIQSTADGLNVIYRGPNMPAPGNIGDLWYEPDGIYENMYQWDGSIWKLILSTRNLDIVKKEVEGAIAQADADRAQTELDINQALTDAQEYTEAKAQEFDNQLLLVNQNVLTATNSANAAVLKADKAIEDAGFIKLDVAQVKTDAITTASTAQSAYNNAISALSKADTAISTTESFSLLVDDLERSITFKADSSRVDTISSKVDSQAIQIKANTDGLVFKAEKSAVDTINQTVNQHTNDISINAQAIATRLTSTEVDNLVASKNYVNQTTLNATATSLSGSITQVNTALANLEIGGRNYLRNTRNMVNYDYWNTLSTNSMRIAKHSFYRSGSENMFVIANGNTTETTIGSYRVEVESGKQYTFSMQVFHNQYLKDFDVYFLGREKGSTESFTVNVAKMGNTASNVRINRFSWTFIVPAGATEGFIRIDNNGTNTSGQTAELYIAEMQLEKGTKLTDHSLAQEDLTTIEKFTTLEATVNGINTVVGNKADQSQITQLAGQITSKVESSTYNSKMTQLDSAINLRVVQSDVTAAILEDKKIKDTRNDNQLPNWYLANYPKQVVEELKLRSVMGVPLPGSAYGQLTTNVTWSDTGTGGFIQTFRASDGVFQRSSNASTNTWGTWDKIAETGKLISQINISTEGILLQGKRIQLDGDVTMTTAFVTDIKAKSLEAVYADIATLKTKVLTADVINSTMLKSDTALITKLFATDVNVNVLTAKTAFINSVKAVTISADKINTGELNAANVNIINLNVSKIVGLNSNFIQSNWNQNGSDVVINAGGLISQTGNLKTTLNAGQITNSSGTKSGTINALGMQIYDSAIGQTTKLYSEGIQFDWYGITRGITQTSEGLEIKPTTGSGARLNSALHLTTGTGNDKIAYLQLSNIDGGTNSRLEMNRLQLSLRHPNGGSLDIADYDYNGQLGRINSGKFRTTTVDGRGIQMEVSQISALAGNQTIYIIPSGTGELRIGNGSENPTLWPVRAQSFVQGSSRNYKTNIKEYKAEALSLLNSMNVVEYDLIKDVESGVINKQIGFISEDSHSISSLDEKGIDIYKTTAVSVKGIQQLSEITYKHEMKIAELEKIIIELKGDK